MLQGTQNVLRAWTSATRCCVLFFFVLRWLGAFGVAFLFVFYFVVAEKAVVVGGGGTRVTCICVSAHSVVWLPPSASPSLRIRPRPHATPVPVLLLPLVAGPWLPGEDKHLQGKHQTRVMGERKRRGGCTAKPRKEERVSGSRRSATFVFQNRRSGAQVEGTRGRTHALRFAAVGKCSARGGCGHAKELRVAHSPIAHPFRVRLCSPLFASLFLVLVQRLAAFPRSLFLCFSPSHVFLSFDLCCRGTCVWMSRVAYVSECMCACASAAVLWLSWWSSDCFAHPWPVLRATPGVSFLTSSRRAVRQRRATPTIIPFSVNPLTRIRPHEAPATAMIVMVSVRGIIMAVSRRAQAHKRTPTHAHAHTDGPTQQRSCKFSTRSPLPGSSPLLFPPHTLLASISPCCPPV